MFFLQSKYPTDDYFTGVTYRESWESIMLAFKIFNVNWKVFRIVTYVNEVQLQEVVRFYYKNGRWVTEPNPLFNTNLINT